MIARSSEPLTPRVPCLARTSAASGPAAPPARPKAGERALRRGEVWTFQGRPGGRVLCRAGSIWLTQEGDRRDIIRSAGGSFSFDRAGRVVVEAFTEARVAVVDPEDA